MNLYSFILDHEHAIHACESSRMPRLSARFIFCESLQALIERCRGAVQWIPGLTPSLRLTPQNCGIISIAGLSTGDSIRSTSGLRQNVKRTLPPSCVFGLAASQ